MTALTARQRLAQRMAELNHTAKKALGQNFLISDHVIGKIIEAVELLQPKELIEIGPGLGALTDILIERYKDYHVFELDRNLAEYWRTRGLTVIEGDALQLDWSQLKSSVLVSNLPYQISSTLVIEKSVQPYSLKNMVLMFQKEVALRIRAKPKTDDYGLLSVVAQEFWTIDIVCEAGPVDFSPSPKVASRVLKFAIKASPIENREDYLKFLKMCFRQRRRILKSNLEAKYTEKLMAWAEKNKKTDKVRAEELSPEELRDLYQNLR